MKRSLSVYWLLGGLLAGDACGSPPDYVIDIRDHLFYPAELVVPANTKFRLVVTNHDSSPEEFESYELNREKIIMGGAKAIIFLGPLEAGVYPFFGEFNPKTAQGTLRVEP